MASARWLLLVLAACAGCGSPAAVDDLEVDADAGAEIDAEVKPDPLDASMPDSSALDAAEPDADAIDAAANADAAVGPARYAAGRDHSPLTPYAVDRLRAIRSQNTTADDRVFAKVGDSITVAGSFLRCFGGTGFDPADLAGRDLITTRDYFAAGVAASTDPYRRDSLAAVVGWSAWAPLRGTPPPLEQELDAIDPAFALVMFGTNDVETMNIAFYGENMIALVDALLARNVIPILSSIPPRDDSASSDAEVPRYSLVARALAEANQIPFIDLEARMRALADHGLGPDGVHPNADPRGACVLDAAGIERGYNLRNLLSLEALDRIRRAIFAGEGALDPDDPPRLGSGSAADPFAIDTLPFTDARDTSLSTERGIDQYACGPQDESGPEIFYRLHLDAPAQVRALVIDRAAVDIDLHHLAGSATAEACDARNDRELVLDLAAGDHYFALDTYGGDARAGAYLFMLSVD